MADTATGTETEDMEAAQETMVDDHATTSPQGRDNMTMVAAMDIKKILVSFEDIRQACQTLVVGFSSIQSSFP